MAAKKTKKKAAKKAAPKKASPKTITIGDIQVITTARMNYEDNWGKVSEDSAGRKES